MNKPVIPLGATGGGELGPGVFEPSFYPVLMSCSQVSSCLIGHDSSERFSSPVPGRTEERPGDLRECETRLTSGYCRIYVPVVSSVYPTFSGRSSRYVVVYHRKTKEYYQDGRTFKDWIGSNEIVYASKDSIRTVEISDGIKDYSGRYNTSDVSDEDVYWLLKGKGVSSRVTREYKIPEGWSSVRLSGRDTPSSIEEYPETYCDSFSIFYVMDASGASFPTPLPSGCSEGSIIGLLSESLYDLNQFAAHIFRRHTDFCIIDDGSILEAPVSVGPMYPEGGHPYNTLPSYDTTYISYRKSFFLLYTVINGDGGIEGAMATIELLSVPTSVSQDITDPGGKHHTISYRTGVENIGWFYRRDPGEADDSRGRYPTPATPLTMPSDLCMVTPSTEFGFVRWDTSDGTYVGNNIDREDAEYTYTVHADAEVPDRRFDISAYDGNTVVVHDDAPGLN